MIHRSPILLLLADLIKAARDCVSSTEDPEKESKPPLIPYKDEVLGAVSAGLRDIASRRSALIAIMGMVTTKNLFSDEELRFVVHIVNQALQEDDSDDDRSLCSLSHWLYGPDNASGRRSWMFYRLYRRLRRDMSRSRHYLSFLNPCQIRRYRARLQATAQNLGVFFLRLARCASIQDYSRSSLYDLQQRWI